MNQQTINAMVFPFILALFVAFLAIVRQLIVDMQNHKKEVRLREAHHDGILAACFAVRNFILEKTNKLEDHLEFSELSLVASLKCALRNIDNIIEKSESNSQHFMFSLFEVRMRLVDYIIFLENYDKLGDDVEDYINRRDGLMASIEILDLVIDNSLEKVTLAEINL